MLAHVLDLVLLGEGVDGLEVEHDLLADEARGGVCLVEQRDVVSAPPWSARR